MIESDNTTNSRLEYNGLLMKGYSSFQNKQIPKALNYYNEAFKIDPQSLHGALVKSIIGVLHMHTCNYSEAINAFTDGLRLCDRVRREKHARQAQNNYQAFAIEIKLNANLALCLLVIGEYRQARQKVQNCISIVRSNKAWSGDLYQTLVYIFFRFTSFEAMKSADFESAESKYDDVTQACFYSTMAINKQLCQSPQQAFQLQKRSLEIWTNKKEYGFALISIRHLLHLAKELNMSKSVINEYDKQLQRVLESEQLQGISEKTLFKGYQEKMKAAKDITAMLIECEKGVGQNDRIEIKGWREATRLKLLRAINSSKSMLKSSSSTPASRQQLVSAIDQMQETLHSLQNQKNVLIQKNLQKSKFVLDAVNYLKAQVHRVSKFAERGRKQILAYALEQMSRYGYQKSIQQKPNSRYNQNQQPNQQQNSTISQKIGGFGSQIKQTGSVIQQKSNPYDHSSYFPSRSNNGPAPNPPSKQPTFPATSSIIPTRPLTPQQSSVRNPNKSVSPTPYQHSHQELTPRSKITDTSFNYYGSDQRTNRRIAKMIKVCEIGQYLMKRNFTSNGGDEKFIKLTKTQIRWAADEKKVTKEGKYQQYKLDDVRGLVYGKVTQTMCKSCNKELEPWKCFSLVMKKRTFDIYCPVDRDIDQWVVGVSAAIERATGKQIVLYTPGKQLWRKMFLILTHYFIDQQNKRDRKLAIPFAVALKRFIENGYRLPYKKK